MAPILAHGNILSHLDSLFWMKGLLNSLYFSRSCLRNVIEEVELIANNDIEVNGEVFQVDFYLGADWKFLATVSGIDSPNCTHACIWCTCPKGERYNCDEEWSVT